MNRMCPRLAASCLQEVRDVYCGVSFKLAFLAGVSVEGAFSEYWIGNLGEFPAASTIKVTILLELYKQFAAGLLDPEESVRIDRSDIVEGGILPELIPGHSFTLRELARLMIIASDNTASNILLDRVGMEHLNAQFKSFGMTQTVMRRKFMEDAAVKGENITTALDLLALLRTIDSPDCLAEPWRTEMIEILHRQLFIDKIPAELPEDVWIANKVGELPGIRHDIAIIRHEHLHIFLVALTQGAPSNDIADRTISRLAKIVYHGLLSGEEAE